MVLSRVQLSVSPWTHQAPLSTKLSRHEYWSGWPFSTPGDPPDPGIEPASLVFPALVGGFFTTVPPGVPPTTIKWIIRLSHSSSSGMLWAFAGQSARVPALLNPTFLVGCLACPAPPLMPGALISLGSRAAKCPAYSNCPCGGGGRCHTYKQVS